MQTQIQLRYTQPRSYFVAKVATIPERLELPGGDVCVLICSVLLEGQGSGTVGIFTSMQQWMAISEVIYNNQMQKKLGILYRHFEHKTVCFLHE